MLQLADVAGHLEERVQPGALAGAERVPQLLEVPGQVAGGIAVPLARLVGEDLRLGACEPHGRDQRVLELRNAVRDRLGRGPDAKTIGRPVLSSQSLPRS